MVPDDLAGLGRHHLVGDDRFVPTGDEERRRAAVNDVGEAAIRAWAQVEDQIREEDHGGIRVLWTDPPGLKRAQLMFRVGRVDEPFARAGITHLVEHLALSSIGDMPYGYNGSVSSHLCAFAAAGDDADVCDFLSRVCDVLRQREALRPLTVRVGLLTALFACSTWLHVASNPAPAAPLLTVDPQTGLLVPNPETSAPAGVDYRAVVVASGLTLTSIGLFTRAGIAARRRARRSAQSSD